MTTTARPPTPRGIYAMLYAYFDRRGRLDRGAMRAQVQWCIARQVHGLSVLGLATEVNKLDGDEKRALLQWLAEDNAGRLPWAATISGRTVREQVALAGVAREAGAGWLILQPPMRRRPPGEATLLRFFDQALARIPIDCAIQNAPEYLGTGLSVASIAALRARHPHFRLLKGEGPALLMERTLRANRGLAVFNGRGGLELVDNLAAGCAGMIVAPEYADRQARIFDAFVAGDRAAAERGYREILPGIVFLMQSLDQMICYGKRLAAARIGIAVVHDRQPAMRPSPLGEAILARLVAGCLEPRPARPRGGRDAAGPGARR